MPENLPLVAWHPWSDVRKRDDINQLNISFPFGNMPPEWILKIRQSYYAAAVYIDNLIGLLMKQVNLNNTIVILTSDHGWSLGENGLWAKYSNFDVALKVPLLFLIPGYQQRSVSTPVELLDIFPTLADLTGLSKHVPKCGHRVNYSLCFEGESLVPLMKSHTTYQRNKNYAISQYPRPGEYPKPNSDKPRLKDIKIMGYSIRTKRYRYTEWISFNNTMFTRNWTSIHGLELYDHHVDPNEAKNCYMKKKYIHTPTYIPAAGAQAFPMDGIGRLGHDPPRGPRADWRVLTTADAAGTNGSMILPKHEVTRGRRCLVTHPMTKRCAKIAKLLRSQSSALTTRDIELFIL
ncbi:hypothetical protein evm_014223 [Chilo suppressalis]|nr:hypothetical protein evm_014223 [Chilo suppressalis]